MLSADMRYLELLKRTYPKIKEHSYEIGEKTYVYMFEESSDIKKIFKNTPPEQAQRLIDTIIFFCQSIDNFNVIYDRLDKIAHVHVKYKVKNNYYPIMKKALTKALCETLNVVESDELVRTWIYGFDCLSLELIHIEDLIRKYSEQDFFPEVYSDYVGY